MRKQALRQAVANHLGSIGYAHSTYAWVRDGRLLVLRVLTTPDARLSKSGGDLSASCYVDLHLPAGKTNRKTLAAALATLPTIGSPKPVLAWTEHQPDIQTSMRLQ